MCIPECGITFHVTNSLYISVQKQIIFNHFFCVLCIPPEKNRNFIQLSHRKIDEDILTEMLQANEIIFSMWGKTCCALMSVVYDIITLGDTVSLEH